MMKMDDGLADMRVNESDSARLTRPEHHSYRTFYQRVELLEIMMMMMLETMKIMLMMMLVVLWMIVMMLGMLMTADENTALTTLSTI